jgi:hypothetical protein
MSKILVDFGDYTDNSHSYDWEFKCGNCDNFPGTIPKDYDGECPYVEDFFNGKKFEETDWTLFNCPKFTD